MVSGPKLMLEVSCSDTVDAIRFLKTIEQQSDFIQVLEYPEEPITDYFDEQENRLRINDRYYRWGYIGSKSPEYGNEYELGFYVSYYPMGYGERTLSEVSAAVSDLEAFSEAVEEHTDRRYTGHLTDV